MIPSHRIPTHPGEILLEEFLEALGVTQVAFAAHIGVPVQRINEIVRGKRGITPETAWLLSQSLETTPEFWLNLQANHDLARNKPKRSVRKLPRAGVGGAGGSSKRMAASSWTFWPWWIAGGLLTLAALALLYWSLLRDRSRGRRRCPRCWYDLSGTAELKCSECGHLEAHERKLYKTRRRWRWAVIGFIALLGGLGIVGFPHARAFDWYSVMPVRWLKQEGTVRAVGGWKARRELIRRLDIDRLSPAQVTDLIEHVLALQADPAATWSPQRVRFGTDWGTFLEEAWDDGRLSEEQLARYLRTAFGQSFTVTPRARVRAGRPLPVRFRTGAPRTSDRWSPIDPDGEILIAEAEIVSATVDGAAVPFRKYVHSIGQAGMGGWRTTPSFEWDLAPGTHSVRFLWRCTAIVKPRERPFPRTKPPRRGAFEAAEWEQVFESTIEVVSVDEPVVELAPDESVRQSIRDAITIELVERQLSFGGTTYGSQYGMILVDTVPVDLSFDVFCRADGVEHQIGAIVVHGNEARIQNAQRITGNAQALFPDAAFVDVILRASSAAAERTLDVERVWDGEIVVEGVPLR